MIHQMLYENRENDQTPKLRATPKLLYMIRSASLWRRWLERNMRASSVTTRQNRTQSGVSSERHVIQRERD